MQILVKDQLPNSIHVPAYLRGIPPQRLSKSLPVHCSGMQCYLRQSYGSSQPHSLTRGPKHCSAQHLHSLDRFASVARRESAIANVVRSDMSAIDGVDIHRVAADVGKAGSASLAAPKVDSSLPAS